MDILGQLWKYLVHGQLVTFRTCLPLCSLWAVGIGRGLWDPPGQSRIDWHTPPDQALSVAWPFPIQSRVGNGLGSWAGVHKLPLGTEDLFIP